ncbi:Subtilisin-like protease SBT3.5, partial [Dichanthelium oligosanthes]
LYIAYLGDVKHGHPNDVVDSHHDLLTTVLGSKEESLASITHNYKHGFSGFAAMLTEDQAKQLAGIWPESRSFNDEGHGPVPSRRKGECQVGQGWGKSNCRKIIGARFYTRGIAEEDLKSDYLSPRDGISGHGRIALCLPTNAQQALTPLWEFGNALKNVLDAGGSGLVFAQYTTDNLDATGYCDGFGIACVLLDLDTGYKIVEYYITAASSAVAKIEPSRSFTSKELLAPKVAAFSSRGPSIHYTDIIKPDIAAPGASILAAKEDSYVTMSGTSMAAPHVAGIVALLKALHPDWSPAALKSAIVATGIWPESRSFSDEGYGPVPPRWKGVCQVGQGWDRSNCSRKIIGARFYSAGVDDELLKTEYLSARDANGHGTHTASTAAGSVVEAVSFHGLAAGTARGGAPRARIAVYKSVWGSGAAASGTTATVLAAIDDTIHDGVDVLSLSLLAEENSFGALHAVQKGITVVYVAGNFGPRPQSVVNTAPWVITVAASKMDRSLPTVIKLGNNESIVGQSLYYQGKNSSRSGFRSLANGGLYKATNFTFLKLDICLTVSEILKLINDTADCQGIACVLVDLDTGHQIAEYMNAASMEDSLASMIHNYKHGFSGFAAMLTEDQAKQLADFQEVISVQPSRRCKTTTTRSWDFLGLNYQMPSELLHKSNYGEDIIIGVIDTGVWPESRSFSDEGYGPVPSRWKGVCQVGQGWDRSNCSRKIIGARFYSAGVDEEDLKADYLSARDTVGHGTHTASTAAGSVVEAVSFHALAAGAARGGAPHARLAVYKSLWATASGGNTGSTATVLAAIDDAIHDGVDVLSLSLALPDENSFGALHAVQKGITVVYAAGNDGPSPQTLENTAPWVITVAASKTDRSFPTVITLGNKQQIVGQSLFYQGKNSSKIAFRSLKDGGECTAGALNGTDLKGKVVLCASPNSPTTSGPFGVFSDALLNVLNGGGYGVIFVQYTTDIISVTAFEGIPCVLVDIGTGKKIRNYIGAARSPVVKIEPARSITGKETLAPKVASFSSRGPSPDYADIIKPDIAAPGASILAAKGDSYEIMSGTSMATPHVAGIVALLKALHPNWSPAALKSAIITTGLPRKIADPFDYGGGNINPNRAADPGLIYDIDPNDYNYFFGCNIKTSVSCNTTSVPGYLLNLPSISVPDLRYPVTISRTVTNVGEVDAFYRVAIESPAGVKIEVEPSVLVFNSANKVHTFQVKLSPMWRLQGDYTFGSITWYNDQKTVRIPVAARIRIHDFAADVA